MPVQAFRPKTVYELLQHSARTYAERIALTYISSLILPVTGVTPTISDKHVSYRQLLDNVNRTARMLLDLSGKSKPVVSLLLPNIPQSQYLLWAAASVGIANPLNPLLSEDALYSLMLKT